jgi:hypothetical protein
MTSERPQFLQLTFRALCHLAATDHRRIAECPFGDKQFSGRIGLQLAISSVFLFAIFAGSLLIGFGQDPISDCIVIVMAFVTAAVVLLVDIQIVQSDFYLHGLELAHDRGLEGGSSVWGKIRRPATVILRLGLSATIAFAFATFFELRLFGSDITRRIDDDYRMANAELFQEVRASYDAQVIRLSNEITNDEKALNELNLQKDELTAKLFATTDLDPEINGLTQKLVRLEAAKETVDTDVLRRGGDAVNELHGVKETTDQSGLPGDGPRYRVAVARGALAREESIHLNQEIQDARRRIADLRNWKANEFERANSSLRRSLLEVIDEIDRLRARRDANIRNHDHAISEREATIISIAQARPDYTPKTDGFLTRITALETLKDRPAVSKITFWTTLVIMTVEVSAVLSKVFFSIPTVYAVRTALEFESMAVALVRLAKSVEIDSEIASLRKAIEIEELRTESLTKQAKRLSKEAALSGLYPGYSEPNRST